MNRLFRTRMPAQRLSGSEGGQIPQGQKTKLPGHATGDGSPLWQMLLLFGIIVSAVLLVLVLVRLADAYTPREGPLITRGQIYLVGKDRDFAAIQLRPKSYILPIRGSSMEPAFYTGQHAVVVPVSTREIKVGDDIAYWPCGIKVQGGSLLGHRIVEIGQDAEGWYAWTQGLQEPLRDWCKVRAEHIVGVMVVIVR